MKKQPFCCWVDFSNLGGADRLPQEFDDIWLLKTVKNCESTEKTPAGVPINPLKFGWKKLPSEPKFRARTGHSALYHKGKVWIFGGQSFKQNRHTSELWVFDCEKKTLEQVNYDEKNDKTSVPAYRNSHGACIDPSNDKMYIFGGANDEGVLRDMHW